VQNPSDDKAKSFIQTQDSSTAVRGALTLRPPTRTA
jgi:hypothetical protein